MLLAERTPARPDVSDNAPVHRQDCSDSVTQPAGAAVQRASAMARREAIRLGAALSLGAFLTGCASNAVAPIGGLTDPIRPGSNGPSRAARDSARDADPLLDATPSVHRRQRRAQLDLDRDDSPSRPPTESTPDYAHDPSTAFLRVAPRSAWAQGEPIPARMDRQSPIYRITVHHDGMPPVELRSRGEVAARIELIREAHLKRGFGDIGYHYVVDPLGGVWEGRPLVYQGAHVANQNPGNLGVVALGNFESQRPTGAQLAALDAFVAYQMRRFRVGVVRLHTHRELAPTLCPGRNMQAHMVAARARGGSLYLA